MRRSLPFLATGAVLAVGLASIMYPWFLTQGVPATVRSENVPEINYIWMLRNLMDAGHPFALWNPSFLGGEAVLTHQAYPVFWLIAAFSWITRLAVETIYPSVIFIVFLMGGMAVAGYVWLLTRHHGAAIVGGLVSMMMPGRLNTIEGLYILLAWSFVPIALWAYELVFVSRKRPTVLGAAGLGLALGLVAWSSIQIALMCALVLGPYFVWRESQRIGQMRGQALGQRIRAWAVVALFAAGIAASYYVPTLIDLNYLGFSRFMSDSSGVNIPVWFLGELLTMRWTAAFTPTRYHHVTWYVGGIALALALLGTLPKRGKWGVKLFWLLVTVGSLLLINGDPIGSVPNLFYRFIDNIPLLNGVLRRSFRLIVPFSLSLAVLAGLGVAQLSQWMRAKAPRSATFALSAVLILAVMVDYHPQHGSFRVLPDYLTAPEAAAVTWLNAQNDDFRYIWPFNYELDEKGYLAGYNAGFAPHQIKREGTWEDSYIGHFAPLPAVELMGMTNVDHLLWRTDTMEPLEQLLALSNVRYVVLHIDSAPNAALFHTAVDAGLPLVAEFESIWILEIPAARAKFQIYYQATILQEAETVVHMAEDLAQNNRNQTVVVQGPLPESVDLTILGAGSRPSADVAPSTTAPDRATVQVQMDEPGILVMAYGWFPGWRVTVDGEDAPLLRVNHAYLGVLLTQGAHSVEFSYRPPWYVILSSAVTILAMLGALGLLLRRLVQSGGNSYGKSAL